MIQELTTWQHLVFVIVSWHTLVVDVKKELPEAGGATNMFLSMSQQSWEPWKDKIVYQKNLGAVLSSQHAQANEW